MRSSAVALAALICWHAPLACQSTTHVDSLIQRVEAGDAAARKQLEAIGRPLIIDAAQHPLSPADAHRLAHVALTLAAPLSGPEAKFTERESFWRGPAVHALLGALADSSDIWPASQLEAMMPYPYLWRSAAEELQQLRALSRFAASLPINLIETRLHLELEIGSLDSAARVLAELQATGDRAARFGHLAAEVAFARGDTASGARAYYAGAAAIADTNDLRQYTWDLFWITEGKELAEWHTLAMQPDVHRRWLEAFWTRRDLDDGQLPGTRLPEQFRRWRLAIRRYRWDLDGGLVQGFPDAPIRREPIIDSSEVPVNRLRAANRVLDDRGSLLLRHGDPTMLPPLNSWFSRAQNLAWQTPAGRLIVGFAPLVASGRFGSVGRNAPVGDPMVACQFDARMCNLLNAIGPESRSARIRIIATDYHHQRETLEHSDGNAVTYADSLGAIVQAFGLPRGGTLVVLAVPAARLLPKDTARTASDELRAHLRVIVGDSAAGRIVAALDTMRSWPSSMGNVGSAWLTGYVVVPTPPGSWTTTITIGDTAQQLGTGRRFSHVPSPAFDGSTLALSDPIVGREGGGLVWHHDGNAIALNPTNAWRTTESVIVNYAIDGMIVGRSYETAFELWPLKGKPKAPSFTVGFTSQATQTTTAVQRELSPRNLTPGEYRLVVRVRDAVTHTEVSRERLLAILK